MSPHHPYCEHPMMPQPCFHCFRLGIKYPLDADGRPTRTPDAATVQEFIAMRSIQDGAAA